MFRAVMPEPMARLCFKGISEKNFVVSGVKLHGARYTYTSIPCEVGSHRCQLACRFATAVKPVIDCLEYYAVVLMQPRWLRQF